MGYRALLFCPDEKTAQTVTLILNELEFAVEACGEPFAAVKKLMGEHFDGVVVDCDNEQNAVLLFKSARQSATNQSALAVAIVEGQAGVAKAFRIGANLVLTKPINVDQAKGTLRVARGLLRKSDAAKPVVHADSAATGVSAAASSSKKPAAIASPTTQAAAATSPRQVPASATPIPWGTKIADSDFAAAHASAPVQDIFEVPISKSENDSAPSFNPVAPDTSSRPAGAQIASTGTQLPWEASSAKSPASGGISAASAPGMVRVSPEEPRERKAGEPVLSKIARTVGTIDERPAGGTATSVKYAGKPKSETAGRAGKASTELSSAPQSESNYEPELLMQAKSGGSKAALFGAVAFLVLALGLYYGWLQLHRQTNNEPAAGNNPISEVKPQPSPMKKTVQDQTISAQPISLPSASAAAAGHDLPSSQKPSQQQSKQNLDDSASGSIAEPASAEVSDRALSARKDDSGPHPLIVKSGTKITAPNKSASEAAAPSVMVSEDSSGAALPNLIDVSTKSTPVLQTLTVSQGVSQGLVIKKVQPNYPPSALKMRLEGSVKLLATVGKTGNITAVKTLGGEPLLARAAADAVKQWKYKPYLLNGQPVEIETQVTINFKLPR